MAEIGLVPFARVAREVAEVAVPQYRSPFAKQTFTQPSLLAIRCLMRYEDWTYREAEVRLNEQVELRAALGLEERVPDYTTLYRCLCRAKEDDLKRRHGRDGTPHAASTRGGDDGRSRWDGLGTRSGEPLLCEPRA